MTKRGKITNVFSAHHFTTYCKIVNISYKDEDFIASDILETLDSFKENSFHLIKRDYCTNKSLSFGENPFHFKLFLIKGKRH